MGHFVYHNLRGWLLTLGLIFVVGGAAEIMTVTQARSLADENRDVARVLAVTARPFQREFGVIEGRRISRIGVLETSALVLIAEHETPAYTYGDYFQVFNFDLVATKS